MDPTPADNFGLKNLAEFLWVVLAMAGGIARSLDSYLTTGVFPRIGMLVGHAVVSGFSGYMVAQVILRISPGWALVGAGIGGYLGTQGLDFVAGIFKARFGGKE